MSQTTESQNRQRLNPVGSFLSDAWRSYKERFPVFLKIIFIPVVMIGMGSIVARQGFPASFLGTLINFLGYWSLALSATTLTISIYQETDFRESYKRGIALFWPMMWVGLLVFFVVMGGFVMLIVPGILMGVWFVFSSYVLVVENKRGLNALMQSREYVRGYWWAVFVRVLPLFIFVVFYFLLNTVLSAIFGKIFGTMAAFAVYTLFVTPFSLTYTYKIYKNLTALKPNLSMAQATSGRGFLITSGIVGLVGPIILFVLFSSLMAAFILEGGGQTANSLLHIFQSANPSVTNSQLVQELNNDLNDQTVWQRTPTSLGTAGSALGFASIVLPPKYEADPFIGGTVIVKSSESVNPYLIIRTMPPTANINDILAQVKTLLQNKSAGNPVTDTATTFAGYPAHVVAIQNQATSKFIVFQAGNSLFLVGITYSTAVDPNLKNLENQVIDKVAESMRVSANATPVNPSTQNSQQGAAAAG